MDREIAKFLLVAEQAVSVDAPRLELELVRSLEITETSGCHIFTRIKRLDSDRQQPCTFYWNVEADGLSVSRFLLFRHTSTGLQKVDIAPAQADEPEPLTSLRVDGRRDWLWELGPQCGTPLVTTLPGRYRKHMLVGEKYELVWAGGEVALWGWGSIDQLSGQQLGPRSPKIRLPGGPRITLEVAQEKEEEQPYSPPPLSSSEVIDGAPKLLVTLQCEETEFPLEGTLQVQIQVKYDAAPESPAITFHTYVFGGSWWRPREGLRLYRRRGDGWRTYNAYQDGCMSVDHVEVVVNVSQDRQFTSLRPGEIWTRPYSIGGQGTGYLPEDTKKGDVFRFGFKGATVDRWDWGDKVTHAETMVTLPDADSGPVARPDDNGGRPKVVVPASNFIDFTMV